MNKLKYTLAVLLALILVVLGGFLPRLTAGVLDRVRGADIAFTAMDPIRLDVPDQEQWRSLPPIEKLSLLRNKNRRVQVSQGIMHSTSEEVWAAFRETITRYWEKGLFPHMEDCIQQHLDACLILDYEGSDHCDLFWQLQVQLSDGKDELTVFCLVDDETRNIYGLYYSTYNATPLLSDGTLEDLAELYFEDLKLEPQLLDASSEQLVYSLRDDYGTEVYLFFHQIQDTFRNVIQIEFQ